MKTFSSIKASVSDENIYGVNDNAGVLQGNNRVLKM
jgi:hypothetical protein